MKKMNLVFKLDELREVHNEEGKSAIMLKLVCPKYVKSVTQIGDFTQIHEGQITYYVFANELPKDADGTPKYQLGKQDGSVTQVIEHYYEGSGVWKPVAFNAITKKVILDDGTEIKVKHLKSL